MAPTLNIPGTKQVLAIFVAASSTLCVATCPENHFQLQESLCCLNCLEGEYVARNCSGGPRNYTGVLCLNCLRCEEIGEETVSQCTQFSNTRCAKKVLQITCRISNADESDGTSAEEPFHI
ncbi:CD27 antigen-like isoform X3 [Garra rufa]|uniref:CD27 antigen-like isoform X3 n=1 Tax=Garra rufa TaxID=137080 RepID=UPI003CCE6F52